MKRKNTARHQQVGNREHQDAPRTPEKYRAIAPLGIPASLGLNSSCCLAIWVENLLANADVRAPLTGAEARNSTGEEQP